MRPKRNEKEYEQKIKSAKQIAMVGVLVMFIDLFSWGNLISGSLGFLGTMGLLGIFAGLVMQQYAKYQVGMIEKLHYWIIFDGVLLAAVLYIWFYLL